MANASVIALRHAFIDVKSDHDASGQYRPTPNEVYTPAQHANALDPNTTVVVGARGTGKSFWAGVLEHSDTRAVAAEAYPQLGLDRLTVRAGYTGLDDESTQVSPQVIQARVPEGEEVRAYQLWQAVIIRAATDVVVPDEKRLTIRAVMDKYGDPEEASVIIRSLDERLARSNQTLLVTFDALDTLSREWQRSAMLLDALFEVIWGLRARKAIRAKVFIRPDQFGDENLRFVELPKLRSSRVELTWSQRELYGMMFWRLLVECWESPTRRRAIEDLAAHVRAPVTGSLEEHRKHWRLLSDATAQRLAMVHLAGPYMGRGVKKGITYTWPYKHLADAHELVTPRSFIKLFVEAARFEPDSSSRVLSPEGMRHGLREASKVRVDQLVVEYPWVKRALAPLAGLVVPCEIDAVYERWDETDTVKIIAKAAADPQTGFPSPFAARSQLDKLDMLAATMARIGLLQYRPDGRVDVPDLFRVAAAMLKKGGTPPKARN
jgi:hypothetical protein